MLKFLRNCQSYKYSLIVILLLIGAVFYKFSFLYRNLSLPVGHVVAFNYFLANKPGSCYFTTGEGYKFRWVGCQNYQIGKYYTILGTVSRSTANSDFGTIYIDVSDISLCSLQKYSFKYIFSLFYRNLHNLLDTLASLILMHLENHFSVFGYNLVTGVTLGSKFTVLSPDFKVLTRQLGLSHMVAVSGFHLNVVYLLVSGVLFAIFPRKFATVLTIMFLVWYMLLVGSPLSLVRAFLMLFFSLILRNFLYKQSSNVYLLFLSFIFLSLASIENVFDIGFQLSFLATTGILIFGPLNPFINVLGTKSATNLSSVNAVRAVFASFWISFCAQLLTWPVLINTFGELSPASLLSVLIFSAGISAIVFFTLPLLCVALIFGYFEQIHWLLLPYWQFLSDLVNTLVYLMQRLNSLIGFSLSCDFSLNLWHMFSFYAVVFVFYLCVHFLSNRRCQYV